MDVKTIFLAITVACFGVAMTRAQSSCNTCMSNGIRCINQTSFNICVGSTPMPDETQILSCNPGEVCTGLGPVCVPEDQVSPVCTNGLSPPGCGVCNGPFSCVSKSTFAFCSQNNITAIRGKCPDNMICNSDSNSANICVSKCGATPSCSLDQPVS